MCHIEEDLSKKFQDDFQVNLILIKFVSQKDFKEEEWIDTWNNWVHERNVTKSSEYIYNILC